MLDIGEKAPDFTLPSDQDGEISLSAQTGRVVLFFYPRDDTSGCTAEAKAFSQAQADFEAAGVRVIGVSKDSLASHAKFRKKHDLSVVLISDEDSDLCERYGVWVEKKMYGKTFMGIERATFLIDEQGTLSQVWRKVKVPGHVDAVLAEVTKA